MYCSRQILQLDRMHGMVESQYLLFNSIGFKGRLTPKDSVWNV